MERCGDSEWSEAADVDLLELLVKVYILERLVLLKTFKKNRNLRWCS